MLLGVVDVFQVHISIIIVIVFVECAIQCHCTEFDLDEMVDQSCPSPQLLGSVLLLKWGPLIPRYVQSIIYLQAAAEELADDVLREASPDLIGALFLFHLCFFILRLHGIVVLITHNQLNAHFGRIWILLRQLFRHLLVILLLNTGVISNADRVRRLAP